MEQPRVLVAITSYNREKSLWALVDKLLEYENCKIIIFDDLTPNIDKSRLGGRVTMHQPDEHCGKAGFWKVYNHMFDVFKASQADYDYYIILPDDVEPCPDFIEKAIKTESTDHTVGAFYYLTFRNNSRFLRQACIEQEKAVPLSLHTCEMCKVHSQ